MVPPRPTRRDALRLSGLALVGLAGCATQGASDPTPHVSSTPKEETESGIVEEPETKTVRNPNREPAVRSSLHTPSRDYTADGQLESGSKWHQEYWLVTEPDERDTLEFTPSTTGVDAAGSFVADTDLSQSTLLIQQYLVEECMQVTLKQLDWTLVHTGPEHALELRADYEDTLTDDCEHTSAHDSDHEGSHGDGKEVRAIISRIPVDATDITAFSFGW